MLFRSADTNPVRLAHEVADIVLAKDLKAPAPDAAKKSADTATLPPLTTEQMTAIAGTYWSREDDDFNLVQVKDGKLQLDVGTDDFRALKQFAPGHFHVADVPWGEDVDFHFIAAEAGKPRGLEQRQGGGKPEKFEVVAAFAPSAEQMQAFAGAYVSDEIDLVYRITAENGKLSLSRARHKPELLKPVMTDTFAGDFGALHFKRDAKGQVSGFVLNAGRIQNLKFAKKAN